MLKVGKLYRMVKGNKPGIVLILDVPRYNPTSQHLVKITYLNSKGSVHCNEWFPNLIDMYFIPCNSK